MFADRLRGYAIAARGWLAWGWPFMLAVAVVANLVVLVLLVTSQSEVLGESRRSAIEAKAAAKAAADSSAANRRLIERGNPCLPEDDQTSEKCVRAAASAQVIAEALGAVQSQHDQQAQNLDDAVNRLIELQERQHGVTVERRTVVPRAATTPAPAIATTTTAPPTTDRANQGRKS